MTQIINKKQTAWWGIIKLYYEGLHMCDVSPGCCSILIIACNIHRYYHDYVHFLWRRTKTTTHGSLDYYLYLLLQYYILCYHNTSKLGNVFRHEVLLGKQGTCVWFDEIELDLHLIEIIVHNYVTSSNHDAADQADTRHWPNAGLMLDHCLRRWPNINSTLDQHLVFADVLRTP